MPLPSRSCETQGPADAMAAFPESCVDATGPWTSRRRPIPSSLGHPLLCHLTPRVPKEPPDLVLRDGRPRSLARFEDEDPEEEEGEGEEGKRGGRGARERRLPCWAAPKRKRVITYAQRQQPTSARGSGCPTSTRPSISCGGRCPLAYEKRLRIETLRLAIVYISHD